jgi:hypothetical protein
MYLSDLMNTIYNMDYLLDLQHSDTKNYELNQVINAIDKECHVESLNSGSVILFHLVCILYSLSVFGGLSVFIYKIIL